MIIGSCATAPSLKNPTTHVPRTIPVADRPTPDVDADVTGIITWDQGSAAVGINDLSSV